jgi:hypothetical protein
MHMGERSRITIQLYLNGGFSGGSTRFFGRYVRPTNPEVAT